MIDREQKVISFLFYNLGKQVFSLFSNFGTAQAILTIQNAELLRISPGLIKYTHIIHTC